MKKRILLIEDDDNLGFVIQDQLTLAGFDVEWQNDGEKGQKSFLKNKPDLCILDVMLPKTDGFQIAQYVRLKDQQTPILFLTARDMVEDRIKGFQVGGDDYIAKPFSMEELLYRIKVFLNRSQSPGTKSTFKHDYRYKSLFIDFKKNELLVDNEKKTLTEKESQLLAFLIQEKERVLKREEILLNIWGDDDYFMGRSLDVFISKIRKYIKDSPIEIRNYHGIGFKWEEQ